MKKNEIILSCFLPNTNNKLERIEPNIELCTITTRFWLSAMMEIINSTALPKVAFNNPPTTYIYKKKKKKQSCMTEIKIYF